MARVKYAHTRETRETRDASGTPKLKLGLDMSTIVIPLVMIKKNSCFNPVIIQ